MRCYTSAHTHIGACVLRSLRRPLCQLCRLRRAGMSLTWALMEGTPKCTCRPVPARCQQSMRKAPRSCSQSYPTTSSCRRKQVKYACSLNQYQSDKRVKGFAFHAAQPLCAVRIFFRGLCLGLVQVMCAELS